MIIERPAVDWLTLTTYSDRAALEADSLVNFLVGDVETWERTIDGYEGREGDGFVLLEGEQNGKRHFMVRLWGDLSDTFMFHPLRPEMDCTKIDLQLTLAWPHGNAFQWFYDAIPVMAAHEKGKAQRARGISPIPKPDGWCTIYVGSKKSKRFYRIYMKGEEGDLYIRFEVVYKDKKDLAGRVYGQVTEQPARMTKYLAREVYTLPQELGIIKPFADFLGNITGKPLPQGRNRPGPETTLNWLVRQVTPAFKRMLGNEDTRFTASMILRDLVEFREGLE
jgi:hypothetical protein